MQDSDGWTALHNCARNGQIRCLQVILTLESFELRMCGENYTTEAEQKDCLEKLERTECR